MGLTALEALQGEATGTSDLETYAERKRCDKYDSEAKEIFEDMFGKNSTWVSESEFRSFMHRVHREIPEVAPLYKIDAMIHLANQRGTSLRGIRGDD